MKLPLNLGGKVAKAALALKGVAPELCVAGSILFGIGCVVTSCIATVKTQPVVKANNEAINDIRHVETLGEDAPLVPVKELSKQNQQNVREIRMNTVMTCVKNYAIPAALGVVSIALNIGGNRILRRNLAATTMALAGLTKSFDEYRARVIADLGKEKDQEYLHGLKKQKAVEVDPETGEVTDEQDIYVSCENSVSQYARWFDEGDWDDANKRWIHQNLLWKEDAWMNQRTLRSVEREMNQKLIIDGFLFLNDVYRKLGLPLSIDGQIVGWTYTGNGDHGVSFGVFDDDPRQLPCNKRFMEGKTNRALLDFNVDGPIINELESFFGKEMTMKLVARRM